MSRQHSKLYPELLEKISQIVTANGSTSKLPPTIGRLFFGNGMSGSTSAKAISATPGPAGWIGPAKISTGRTGGDPLSAMPKRMGRKSCQGIGPIFNLPTAHQIGKRRKNGDNWKIWGSTSSNPKIDLRSHHQYLLPR